MSSKSFGEAVRCLRRAQNLTQKELAERCGMKDSAIRRIERGSNPTLKTTLTVLNALDYHIEIKENKA